MTRLTFSEHGTNLHGATEPGAILGALGVVAGGLTTAIAAGAMTAGLAEGAALAASAVLAFTAAVIGMTALVTGLVAWHCLRGGEPTS